MGAAVTVREATLDDLDHLVEVHVRARLAYYGAGGLAAGEIVTPSTRDELRTGWSEAIRSARKRVWCATLDGHVVGIAAMGPPLSAEYGDDRCGQLYQIHVLPDRWGHGTGSALHAVFLRYLAEVDRPTGVLEAWERNTRAQSFYARHGWRPTGGSRPGPGDSRYLHLRLRLAPTGSG